MAASVTPVVKGAQDSRWPRPARLTALYDVYLRRGAQVEERDGWLLLRSYTDLATEQTVLRSTVGLLDIGESGKIDLKSKSLDGVLASSFAGAGHVDVGMSWADDGAPETRVCRLTDEQALILTPPAAFDATLDLLRRAAAVHDCAHVTDLTGALCGVRLLGPHAPALLERLSSLDLAPDRFAHGALVQGPVARVHTLIVRRDRAGLTGYDLFVDRDLGIYFWETLVETGAPLDLMPVSRHAEEGL